jgi:hypothetical protein
MQGLAQHCEVENFLRIIHKFLPLPNLFLGNEEKISPHHGFFKHPKKIVFISRTLKINA